MSTPPRATHPIAIGLLLLFSGAAVLAQEGAPPVAGLQPDRRPEAAPRITVFVVDRDTKSRRLHGVSKPWPGNLERIAEQGAWFSPMFHPGMTGRYDLRQWHGARS